ncbi:MAG: ABC transporter permease [Thermodesulfobacteriota bacterium]
MSIDASHVQDIPAAGQHSLLADFWRTFKRNRLALTGLAVFLLFFVLALLGLVLTSGPDPVLDPAQVRLQDKLLPPLSSPAEEGLQNPKPPALGVYILGTDELGRDVLARMLQGAWVSLTVGFVAVGISVAVGICLGGIAGYFGNALFNLQAMLQAGLFLAAGLSLWLSQPLPAILLLALAVSWTTLAKAQGKLDFDALRQQGVAVDTLIMRFVDIMLCFPSFFLILTVIALLPASIYNIMIVIGLTSWMGTARFVRAEFLSLREQDFVLAARALGVSNARIILQHMLPNALAPVFVSATIGIATAILTEAGLSFLGFGVPPPQATWGNILSEGKRFIFDAPWLTLIPGSSILIVVLAFNLFGEGLRDALNPKLQE